MADPLLNGLVVDVETTMKCPVGNNKANPFWPENRVVMKGVQDVSHQGRSGTWITSIGGVERKLSTATFLVGHNIAFDIHHLLKAGTLKQEQLGKLQIWDTQLAEYLLTGQQHKWASLDELSAKRGGIAKDGRVSTMFKAGKGADEVPEDMLKEYLWNDLKNTNKVFWSQYAEALDKGMRPLIWSQMDARLATIEMTYNGLAIDTTFLRTRAAELRDELLLLEGWLHSAGHGLTGHPLDPTSPAQLSTILFGGEVKWKENEKVGTYKNGKDKYKQVEHVKKIYGPVLHNPEWVGKNGKPSTADDVIEELLGRPSVKALSPYHELLEKVQDYRDKSKQLSTYFDALDKLIMPDGFIHHNLNHCATGTGRLACSEPNLQNQSTKNTSDIKKAFVSRWGDDGYIVEADYSQLEMMVLAVLSGDTQLMEDIATGTDMHRELFLQVHSRYPTEEERWWFKRCSFALVYGGGVGAIAAQGRTDRATAKRFIEVFYTRYPGVKAWHDELIELAKGFRYHDGTKDTETGLPIGKVKMFSKLSNRRYIFREYPNSPEVKAWKHEECSFSPTELKNYQVQGGATGDIVPLVIGRLFRVLKNNPRLADKCLLINTVHDSVLLDIHKSVLREALLVIRQVMESAPTLIKETWGYDWPLPFKVGISYGPNWFEQKEVDDNSEIYIDLERKAA